MHGGDVVGAELDLQAAPALHKARAIVVGVSTTLWSLEHAARIGDSPPVSHTIAFARDMSSAALVLFDHAQFLRNSATRTRQLALEATVSEVAAQLLRFAAELDERALELENRAASIAKTVARTRALSDDIRRLVEDATERGKGPPRKLK